MSNLEFQISFNDISTSNQPYKQATEENTKHQLVYITERFLNAFQEM